MRERIEDTWCENTSIPCLLSFTSLSFSGGKGGTRARADRPLLAWV